MDGVLKEKHNLMIKIEQHERALIELSSWEIGSSLSDTTRKLTGEIDSEEKRDGFIKTFKYVCSLAEQEKMGNGDKMYLSEIVSNDKVVFSSNNLILAPTGSGKSYFMRELIASDEVLLLVSTTSLKDRLVPESTEEREKLGSRMYSSKRKQIYGDAKYKILVMTYSEFGEKMKYTDNFAEKYSQIFCDEIHSLFNYYSMGSNESLLGVIKYLFAVKKGQTKHYFTATDEYIEGFKLRSSELFNNLRIFNYLDHPDIVKHLTLSSYKISGLEQVRPHLIAKKEGFEYFDYKVFAFCKTIRSQLYLKEIMEAEGFKPIVLWSVNNEDHIMNEEQLKQRDYILRTGLIPDGYNSLIINSAMQEGWDLLDPKVKLVVMNTTSKTESIQALGRVRKDVDILIYKVDSNDVDYYIDFPEKLLNVPLTTSMKKDFCKALNIENVNGRKLKWTSVKNSLGNQGFLTKEKIMLIEGKRSRVSIVSLPSYV